MPRKDAPAGEDRWTFSSVSRVLRETRAAFRVLRRRFGERIARSGHTLVGFSLGALLAPEVASLTRQTFHSLVLVEGVQRFRRRLARRLHRRGIRRVAYLCGEQSHTHCRENAEGRVWYLRRAKIEARVLVMPGTGHAHPKPFAPLAGRVLTWVRAASPAPRRGRSVGPTGRGSDRSR